MGRSIKKGPFVSYQLLEKINKAGSYLFCGQCHICSVRLGCRVIFSDNDALVQTAGYFFEGLYEPVNHNNNEHNNGDIEKEIAVTQNLALYRWGWPVGLLCRVLVSLALIARILLVSRRGLYRRCCCK